MKSLHFRIDSACPLLQHDDKTVNRRNKYTQMLKPLQAKRKKTDEDLDKIEALEWRAGLYYDDENQRYFMKMECLEATMVEAAKKRKLGKVFEEAVRLAESPDFHFEHEHLTPEELYKIDDYVDLRAVKIQRAKILRCRPIFKKWHIEFEVWYEPTRVNEEEIRDILEYAGKFIGICDFRKRFGKFRVTEIRKPKKR